MRQVWDRWFNKPHGDPSGVCTGHKKPGDTLSIRRKRLVKDENSTPRLGKQLPHGSRFKLGEEGASVYAPEMTNVPEPIELFCNNGET
jgi:hypothetical protein